MALSTRRHADAGLSGNNDSWFESLWSNILDRDSDVVKDVLALDVVKAVLARDSEIQAIRDLETAAAAPDTQTAMISGVREQRRPKADHPRSFHSGRCWHCNKTGHSRNQCADFLNFLLYHIENMEIGQNQLAAAKLKDMPSQAQENQSEQLNVAALQNSGSTADEEKFEDAVEHEASEESGLSAILNLLDRADQGW